MKTKTLLLLSLGCAVAILGAGIGLVFKIGSSGDASTPIAYEVDVEVGDLNVSLLSSERLGDRQSISIEVLGVNDDLIMDSFVVISSGEQVSPEPNMCASSVEVKQVCEVEFVLPAETAEPAVLLVTRGEERARWVLAGRQDPLP